jgi:hypothetical protein
MARMLCSAKLSRNCLVFTAVLGVASSRAGDTFTKGFQQDKKQETDKKPVGRP